MPPVDRRVSNDRTVKPRKPVTNADRPIVAVLDEWASDENGTLQSTSDFICELYQRPLSIIVTGNESLYLLRRIQSHYAHQPSFDFRVAPIEREIFTGKNNGRKLSLSLAGVAYVGWRNQKCGRNNSKRNHFHLLIDPFTFSGSWLTDRSLTAYIQWAQEVRDFCIAQKWNLRATQGSVARQALQDTRFYPDARRKVPRATNDRVRKHLPGNHYQTTESDHTRSYTAEYLDQSRAHHYHAISARLPDSNSLVGYGNFRDPESRKVHFRRPERIASFLDGFMGMIYGYVYWPKKRRESATFIPKCLANYGKEEVDDDGSVAYPIDPIHFFTEDLPLFDMLGVRVTGIIAAWGSKQRDTGLARYAKWAISELDKGAPPVWKKGLLLSPYGALATTARRHSVGFHQSKGGEHQTLVSKSGVRLPIKFHQTKRIGEPSTNNVLHRALIESSNRTETLLFAQMLDNLGYRVLCIYVDAVIIEADEDLSYPLWPPWRLDTKLTGLRILSENQFVSNEIAKLPGITGHEIRRKVSLGTMGKATHLGSESDMRIRKYEAWAAGVL